MSELDTFRSENREWFEENCPHEVRDLSFHWEEAHEIYRLPKAKVWLERMAEKAGSRQPGHQRMEVAVWDPTRHWF